MPQRNAWRRDPLGDHGGRRFIAERVPDKFPQPDAAFLSEWILAVTTVCENAQCLRLPSISEDDRTAEYGTAPRHEGRAKNHTILAIPK